MKPRNPNPYINESQPRVKVAAKANVDMSPIAVLVVILSLVVLLLNIGAASAT